MNNTYYIIENIERVYSKELNLLKLNRTFEWKIKAAFLQKQAASNKIKIDSEIKKCTICNNDHSILFCTIYEYPYLECTSCGHIFLGYEIADESIIEMYKNHSDTVYLDNELFDIRINDIAIPKIEFIKRYVPTEVKLLDIGAGVGEIVAAADKMGWYALGLDADPVEVEFAQKRGINVENTFVTSKNIKSIAEKFNIVTFFNVIEHIKDPLGFLRIISTALNKDTLVCVEVPRHPSISSICNIAFPDMVHRHIYPPEHLNIFTEKSMEIMLKECSLVPIAIWVYGQDFYELISCAFSTSGINNKIINDFVNMTSDFQKIIDKNNLSDFMLVVARKE